MNRFLFENTLSDVWKKKLCYFRNIWIEKTIFKWIPNVMTRSTSMLESSHQIRTWLYPIWHISHSYWIVSHPEILYRHILNLTKPYLFHANLQKLLVFGNVIHLPANKYTRFKMCSSSKMSRAKSFLKSVQLSTSSCIKCYVIITERFFQKLIEGWYYILLQKPLPLWKFVLICTHICVLSNDFLCPKIFCQL